MPTLGFQACFLLRKRYNPIMNKEALAELFETAALHEPYQAATRASFQHPTDNQDALYCDPDIGLAAVFDGLGGHAHGSKASQAALGGLVTFVRASKPSGDYRDWLARAANYANLAASSSRRADGDNQATTMSLVLRIDNKVYMLNVGDSRSYVFDGKLRQISNEHFDEWLFEPALLEEVLDTRAKLDSAVCADDLDSLESIKAWRHRNIVQAVIPDSGSFSRDDVRVFDCAVDAKVLVTSDGVHDNLTLQEIEDCLEGDNLEIIAHTLLEKTWKRMREDHFRSKLDDVTIAIL